ERVAPRPGRPLQLQASTKPEQIGDLLLSLTVFGQGVVQVLRQLQEPTLRVGQVPKCIERAAGEPAHGDPSNASTRAFRSSISACIALSSSTAATIMRSRSMLSGLPCAS